jgi:hypothetical protein
MLSAGAICFNCQPRCSRILHQRFGSITRTKKTNQQKPSSEHSSLNAQQLLEFGAEPCGSRLLFLPHAEPCTGDFNCIASIGPRRVDICCCRCLLTLRDEKCPKNDFKSATRMRFRFVCRDLRPLQRHHSSTLLPTPLGSCFRSF